MATSVGSAPLPQTPALAIVMTSVPVAVVVLPVAPSTMAQWESDAVIPVSLAPARQVASTVPPAGQPAAAVPVGSLSLTARSGERAADGTRDKRPRPARSSPAAPDPPTS